MPAAPPKAPPKAPPSVPRVVILMEAPTNPVVAAHFTKLGYSVEVIIDLKYCTTPLLKSAKYLILGPNPEKSPYYEKIKSTLKKMVPDRLFEEQGGELLLAIREKAIPSSQKPKASHPGDSTMKTQSREAEDKAAIKEAPKPDPISPPTARSEAQGLISTTLLQNAPEDALDAFCEQLSRANPETGSFVMNEEMEGLIGPYLKASQALGFLEAQRQSLLLQDDLAEDAKGELEKQQSPLKKPLTAARQLAKAEQFATQVAQAKEQGKEFPKRKLPEGEFYDNVIELGAMTDTLVTEKAHLRIEIARAFAKNTCKDRLYRIISSLGIDGDLLHGTLYLYLSLMAYRVQEQNNFKALHKKWKALYDEKGAGSKKGIGGLFKKKQEETEEEGDSPEYQEALSNLSRVATTLYILDTELSSYEKDMCEAFWSVYEGCCTVILQDRLKNASFIRYVRAFMRFGLICDHPAMISKAQSQAILNICDEDKSDFQHQDSITNTVYPDEALVQIREGVIPPSFDEELELSGQGTPKYKYDKIVRKIYTSYFQIKVYEREKGKWGKKVTEQKAAGESAEKMQSETEKGSKEYKNFQAAIREARAEINRVSKIVEKMDEIIETQQNTIDEQNESLKALDFKMDIKDMSANEAKTIRNFCKLMGNRKEVFLPFILRDNFKPDQNNLYNRQVTAETLEQFENDDTTIFSTDIVNAQNPRKRVMVRFSPTVMIYPVAGNIGSCISHKNSSDPGRVIFPAMGAQQVPLRAMMLEVFADFRYRTAKEEGGMDPMKSDTIFAAYNKVLWDYRKKGKEFREKAGIYTEMKDDKNFRVHYKLYVDSMDEAGKKLFFKCHEMYEGFAKYIPLPPGTQKLSKG